MDDDLPVFEPVGPPKFISDTEILRARQLKPGNSEIASAEAFCQAGDVSAATARVVLSSSEDVVCMLLQAGVPVSIATIKTAITNKSLPILSLFLQHGWDINEEEDWCLPPLLSHALATQPDEPLISWFLSNGADPNATCQMDITPLSTAAGCGPLATVQQLFAHCPSTTSFGGYLLHWAARRTSDDADDVVNLVLERCQPDMNIILYENDVFSYEVRKVVGLGTALHEAARMGRPSVVKILVQKGTDVTIRDSRGNTALEVAEFYENQAVIGLLRRAEQSLAAKM